MPPRRRRPAPVEARLLRPSDLVHLTVTGHQVKVSRRKAGPVLVADGARATLTVTWAPQHLGEQAWPQFVGSPDPAGLSRIRAAGPSRLVYEVPDGVTIPWNLEGLLAALPTLRLRVVPLATPGPDHYADDDSPESSTSPGGLVIPPWLHDVDLTKHWRRNLGDLAFGSQTEQARTSTGLGSRSASVLLDAQATRLLRGQLQGRSLDSLGLGDPVGRHRPPRRGRKGAPRSPRTDETAIEAPYRLIVSPSPRGAFSHSVPPLGAPDGPDRVELWHSDLTVRVEDESGTFVRTAPEDEIQRIVRAIWTKDLDAADASATTDPYLQSLLPRHRRGLVRQSAATDEGVVPLPLRVRALSLTALGAQIDWSGAWDWQQYPRQSRTDARLRAVIESYRHKAGIGRDAYVRVTEPGFLFPFGHRAVFVTVTERKIEDRSNAVAYLRQRYFIVVREPTRAYAGRDTPLRQVTLAPLVTPDLDLPTGVDAGDLTGGDAPDISVPFFPKRGGIAFAWDLTAVDQAGDVHHFAAPLLFVAVSAVDAGATPTKISDDYRSGPSRIDGRGQSVSVAASASHGDTAIEVSSLDFDGVTDTEAYTSRPTLARLEAVLPAMRHLAPSAPAVALEYAPPFLDPSGDAAGGFGAGNPGQVFLRLVNEVPIDFGGGTDRSGGFLSPNLVVRALSRTLGAVGEDGTGADSGLAQGEFSPARFLDGALPKIFGLLSLVDLLEALGVDLDHAPSFVTEALDAISGMVAEAHRLESALQDAKDRLQADLARAAHAGAADAVQQVIDQLDAVADPLQSALTDLLAALAGLAGNPSRIGAVTTAIAEVKTALAPLAAALDHPLVPAALRAAVEVPQRALDALLDAADAIQAVEDFARNVLTPGHAVTARYEWHPTIRSWPQDKPLFKANDAHGLSLGVEVRAGAQAAPVADVSAELRSFDLQIPGEPLMAMHFSRLGFRVGSHTKPEVDVVFDGLEFLGALGFIETLRRMIPFDGFADPPYVDITPEGAKAGFDLALPNVSVGVFSLENIALGADARVPFLGDAVTVGFSFCHKDSPFRLTVMCIGGGGWVGIRVSPKGMVELDMGLEAGASLSVDLGVASGSVSVMVGVYLRLEGDKGSLTGYFRIRGEVDVLGLISASITLELSLVYHFETGKLVGRASLVVDVEVLFFSASVEITCERQLAGSKGDPVLADIMPLDAGGHSPDWSDYCLAFAEGA